ncbi:hypothetical protein N9X87_00440 [bacterium]|nr:hypothetical protein [bacterium]
MSNRASSQREILDRSREEMFTGDTISKLLKNILESDHRDAFLAELQRADGAKPIQFPHTDKSHRPTKFPTISESTGEPGAGGSPHFEPLKKARERKEELAALPLRDGALNTNNSSSKATEEFSNHNSENPGTPCGRCNDELMDHQREGLTTEYRVRCLTPSADGKSAHAAASGAVDEHPLSYEKGESLELPKCSLSLERYAEFERSSSRFRVWALFPTKKARRVRRTLKRMYTTIVGVFEVRVNPAVPKPESLPATCPVCRVVEFTIADRCPLCDGACTVFYNELR